MSSLHIPALQRSYAPLKRRRCGPHWPLLFGAVLGCGVGDLANAQSSGAVQHALALIDAPQPSPTIASLAPAQTQTRAPADGPLQLSLQEAVRMALERNLDVQIEQVDQTIAEHSVQRTVGGGTPRAINYTISEPPMGESVTALPLLASTASILSPTSVSPSGVAVSSSYDVGNILETQHSLSISPTPFSAGAPVPAFDIAAQGQFAWFRREASIPSERATTVGVSDTTTDTTLGNVTLAKAFSSGASIQLGINNFVEAFYSPKSSAVPFTHPNAVALFAQPLFRGAGRANNTRFIAIAKTNRNISAAILEQQMISTVSGVEILYYDLISLQDSVAVQEKALMAANDLLNDDRQQLGIGRMPPIEVTRAQALVTASQLALIQTNALRQQQENILRSVLDPQSLTNKTAKLIGIVATEQLLLPPAESPPPMAELIELAWTQRPDIREAMLQISNGERSVRGSANARLPELDLYAEFQTRGTVIPGTIPLGGNPLTGVATFDAVPAGGQRSARVYEVGIQFNLPVQNRVDRADLGADRAQLQQERLRIAQIKAGAAAEVRNAMIGLGAAKQAAEAAAASRKLQEELLHAEAEKFRAGMSTNSAVIEQQTYLAQAETTEVGAKAAWKKAAVQLRRALGSTLQHFNISVPASNSKLTSHP